MNRRLLDNYRRYARTAEAYAVLFATKNIKQTEGHWVDIIDCEQYEMSDDEMHFRFVIGGLYRRKIRPNYPPKSQFTVNGEFREREYKLMVRAITWETAHKDIDQQKRKGIAPWEFKITGVSYDKNRDCVGFFRDDAPAAVKALETNINDRTDPLWETALQYANEPEYVYKVKQVYLAPKRR
jgi:hypothetical protein